MVNLEERWRTGFAGSSIQDIQYFLEMDSSLVARPIEIRLKNGSTRLWGPLFAACAHLGDVAKARVLVEAGADLDNSELGTHWPGLSFEITEFLINSGANVNQPSYLGFHAIGLVDLDTFYLLLENGLSPNWPWPYNGETPLHVQARHDDDQHVAVAYALIDAGADINAQALSGLADEPIMENEHFVKYGKETPLHFAARLGNIRHLRLLLRRGADTSLRTVSRIIQPKETTQWEGDVTQLTWPLSTYRRVAYEPYEGETPLDMARKNKHTEIVRLLEAAG